MGSVAAAAGSLGDSAAGYNVSSRLPTLTFVPGSTAKATTRPALGAGTSKVALSDSSVTTG
jgi:hypothetical protein